MSTSSGEPSATQDRHDDRTGHSSTFKVTDAQINVGLSDDTFSQRNISRGQ